MSIGTFVQPMPTGKEIKLSKYDMLVSKTNVEGTITFSNSNFSKISGYKKNELIGSSHNIVRHPDMPKAIFYLMFERLKKGKNFPSVIKNLSKNGDHYWVTTDFSIFLNKEGEILSFTAFREVAPKHVVKELEPLYQKLVMLEQEDSMETSLSYLESFLNKKNMTYDEYIKDLAKPKWFGAMFFSKLFYR